jgi:tol-pal system protein YbgF
MTPAKNSIRNAGFSLLIVASGLAPAFAQSALTPEQLTLRVERLTELSQRSEAKLGTIQEQLAKLNEDMSRMGRLIDNRAMLDMIQLVDQLSEEISQLNGQIEQQGFDLESIKKRQRELYLDIDRRLRDIESGATAQAGSISVPQIDTPAPAAASGQQAPSEEAPSTTLKEGRYKNAKTELKTFLNRYPNSSYAGNAQYWLAEAHYVTRNFEQGIVEFKNVLDKYPSSNKVPDAMLKLGYTFYELKQFPQAKQVLTDLREKFPDETAARLAAKRLDRIRKEGH